MSVYIYIQYIVGHISLVGASFLDTDMELQRLRCWGSHICVTARMRVHYSDLLSQEQLYGLKFTNDEGSEDSNHKLDIALDGLQ